MGTLKSEGKQYTNRLLDDTAYSLHDSTNEKDLRLIDFATGKCQINGNQEHVRHAQINPPPAIERQTKIPKSKPKQKRGTY
jgi:hypothetical protein